MLTWQPYIHTRKKPLQVISSHRAQDHSSELCLKNKHYKMKSCCSGVCATISQRDARNPDSNRINPNQNAKMRETSRSNTKMHSIPTHHVTKTQNLLQMSCLLPRKTIHVIHLKIPSTLVISTAHLLSGIAEFPPVPNQRLMPGLTGERGGGPAVGDSG